METSGHLGFYAENMYPGIELDDEHEYRVKPMNCPFHILIYQRRARIRTATCPCACPSWALSIATSALGPCTASCGPRGFTQDDSHTFCTREQLADGALDASRLCAPLAERFRIRPISKPTCALGPEKAHGWTGAVGRGHRGPGACLWTVGVPVSRSRRARGPSMGPKSMSTSGTPSVAGGSSPRFRSTSPCQSVSISSTSLGEHAGTSRHDPLCQGRINREVHGRADRALCRGIPDVAGAGSGHDRPRCRSASRVRRPGSSRPGSGSPGRSRRLRRNRRRQNPQVNDTSIPQCSLWATRTSRPGTVGLRYYGDERIPGRASLADAVNRARQERRGARVESTTEDRSAKVDSRRHPHRERCCRFSRHRRGARRQRHRPLSVSRPRTRRRIAAWVYLVAAIVVAYLHQPPCRLWLLIGSRAAWHARFRFAAERRPGRGHRSQRLRRFPSVSAMPRPPSPSTAWRSDPAGRSSSTQRAEPPDQRALVVRGRRRRQVLGEPYVEAIPAAVTPCGRSAPLVDGGTSRTAGPVYTWRGRKISASGSAAISRHWAIHPAADPWRTAP